MCFIRAANKENKRCANNLRECKIANVNQNINIFRNVYYTTPTYYAVITLKTT